MTYLELNEVKEELEKRGIKYREIRYKGGIFVYISGLMQEKEPEKHFRAEVRISRLEGDDGYRVKACGELYKNRTIEQTMELIKIYAL